MTASSIKSEPAVHRYNEKERRPLRYGPTLAMRADPLITFVDLQFNGVTRELTGPVTPPKVVTVTPQQAIILYLIMKAGSSATVSGDALIGELWEDPDTEPETVNNIAAVQLVKLRKALRDVGSKLIIKRRGKLGLFFVLPSGKAVTGVKVTMATENYPAARAARENQQQITDPVEAPAKLAAPAPRPPSIKTVAAAIKEPRAVDVAPKPELMPDPVDVLAEAAEVQAAPEEPQTPVVILEAVTPIPELEPAADPIKTMMHKIGRRLAHAVTLMRGPQKIDRQVTRSMTPEQSKMFDAMLVMIRASDTLKDAEAAKVAKE